MDIWIRILHELFYATLKDRETTVGSVSLRNVSEQKVRMSPILPGKEGAVKTVDGRRKNHHNRCEMGYGLYGY